MYGKPVLVLLLKTHHFSLLKRRTVDTATRVMSSANPIIIPTADAMPLG